MFAIDLLARHHSAVSTTHWHKGNLGGGGGGGGGGQRGEWERRGR